ncbi:MAG: HigA family addiction module antidote protein [Phycisphaerales bacterium]|nr:HigA family addiction module antidote protein [Hyphomonadaceae bacterium]
MRYRLVYVSAMPVAPHPGPFIRMRILPEGMGVAKAAKILDVGRPALSNLLSGSAALSADMAEKLARAFDADPRALLDMQAAYDAAEARARGAGSGARAYVPPFLGLKARDIEGWAVGAMEPRFRFAVLLRTLVHSTAVSLSDASFPGNDNAERPGWDGFTEAGEGTPWVPAGRAGWEFGVNADAAKKAARDYANRVTAIPAEERAEITYIFVTPTIWRDKDKWAAERRAEGNWKDVRVYDAATLEEWLEQSIPAQAWLGNEIDPARSDALSLDNCWRHWANVCEPELITSLFSQAIESGRLVAKTRLAEPGAKPLIVAADSRDEALAFLHCLFADDDPDFGGWRDRTVVFSKPGLLSKLEGAATSFVAVAANRDVEKELAQFKDQRAIVVCPRNLANSEPDIILEPLAWEPFERSLMSMGFNRDEVRRLSYETGRSLTVLRRRLALLEPIRNPEWAVERDYAEHLIPFMLAGAWRDNNGPDQVILSFLAGDAPHDELERRHVRLMQLEDAPVWAAGAFRGVVSKTDALFTIAPSITRRDLDRFFTVAELVLSERDPALELPPQDRWAASIYKKNREISDALRDGIAESLVLLSVHGDVLLRAHTGLDVEARVRRLVRTLLRPNRDETALDVTVLQSQSGDLPMYAEAAPEEFLELVEADLASNRSGVMALMTPVSGGFFGHNPRTGILWALENLAWSPEYFPRVVLALGEMSKPTFDDNWSNKPIETLSSLFRAWMPQTGASLEQRARAFDLLVKRYPEVGWRLALEQFDGTSTVGHYAHKPRWRSESHGMGEPKKGGEERSFVMHALETALGWTKHTRETLGDLAAVASRLPPKYQEEIWFRIEDWSAGAGEEDRAWLREKIRVGALTRRAVRRRKSRGDADQTVSMARRAYEALAPKDVVLKHQWLFLKHWVEESADELEDEELDFKKRDERIGASRSAAITEVFAERGFAGLVALAEGGEAAFLIGRLAASLVPLDDAIAGVLALAARNDFNTARTHRLIVQGVMAGLPAESEQATLETIAATFPDPQIVDMLTLMPFRKTVWDIVAARSREVQNAYWNAIPPDWDRQSRDEFSYAVTKLIEAGRPRAAFLFMRFDLEIVETRLLHDLMRAIVSDCKEAPKTYQLEQHDVQRAFEILDKSKLIPFDEMAALELQYLDALDDHGEKSHIPNLERYIERSPELFVQALVFAYKRDDDGEDPSDLQVDDPKEASARATSAYKLLHALGRIPGRNEKDELDADRIETWIGKVRALAKDLARSESADHLIGQLLSNAPLGEDEVWPCEPVRDALEHVTTGPLEGGITIGLLNGRGAQWRGSGGDQERDEAAKYERYAKALQYTHPRVSRIMRSMADDYLSQAKWQDAEADVRKRLRS